MSEFDILNGKLDKLIAIATRGEIVPPEPSPVPLPHPEAPPPVAPTAPPPSSFTPRGGPPRPNWVMGLSYIAGLTGGVVYWINGPTGRGYMVSITQGANATLNGAIGGSTQITFDATGTATIVASENCEAAFDPI